MVAVHDTKTEFCEEGLSHCVVDHHKSECVLVRFSQLFGDSLQNHCAISHSVVLRVDLQGIQCAQVVAIAPSHQFILLIEGTHTHIECPQHFELLQRIIIAKWICGPGFRYILIFQRSKRETLWQTESSKTIMMLFITKAINLLNIEFNGLRSRQKKHVS